MRCKLKSISNHFVDPISVGKERVSIDLEVLVEVLFTTFLRLVGNQ